MSLTDIFADGIELINQETTDLQDKFVTLAAWTGDDGIGNLNYAAAIPYPALVDLTARTAFGASGELITVKATVTFLYPIPPTNSSQFRTQPIDLRDVITLPDGSTGPIISIGGFINADTHKPFFSKVEIGK